MMERMLQYKCPDCSINLKKVGGMHVATQVVRRACKNCGAKWQIVIRPIEVTILGSSAWLDEGTFARVEDFAA